MIEVPANETGMVRIFAVNGASTGSGTAQSFLSRLEQSPEQIAAEAARLQTMLGISEIDPTFTETIAVSDVRDLGLTQYLATAMDIPHDTLSADRARLDALEGEVLIVLSRALGFGAQSLRPGPDLTFIGAYRMAEAPLSGDIPAHPAPPMPAPASAPPAAAPKGVGKLPFVLLGLLLAAGLVLLLARGGT